MSQLSSEERIARVEQAPKEVQVMVAKAFLRDDIDDEDVQYLFNSDTPEQLNDPEEHVQIENLNAEDPEGIGAQGFTMRTSRPANNKNYIVTGSGGWNTCIKGNPQYGPANALANCVGYASGRFNEIINIARDTNGCTYKNLNCNAFGFKEKAEAAGLETGSTPRLGAIICWGKEGGAGHVAVVERVDNNNQIYTSESGWGSSSIFWNQTRTNSNGRWGCGNGYYFRCFIYLPSDVQNAIGGTTPSTPITPNVDRDTNRNQIEIKVNDLRVREGAGLGCGILGFASVGIYNYSNTADVDGYIWYQIADGQWIASSDAWTAVLPKTEPQPAPAPSYRYNIGDQVVISGPLYTNANADSPAGSIGSKVTTITRRVDGRHPYNTEGDLGWMDESSIQPYTAPVYTGLQVGDTVKIVGTGNGNSLGTSATAYGIGWTRQILRIWDGRAYPYQVGNGAGTTGFYQESSLQKI